jgi:predicted aspartyl protease
VLIGTTLNASAQVKLDALTRDGYGVAQIRRPSPNTLMVRATINSRTADVLVDTGCAANGLVLDESFSRGATESMKDPGRALSGTAIHTRKGKIDNLLIGNAQITGVPALFGAIQGFRDAEARKVGSEGMVGAGFLRACSAVIDLHNLRLYLKPPGTGKRVALGPALQDAGLSEVPFRMAGDTCLIDAEVNGVRTTMLLDTGAYASLIDEPFATRASLRADGIRLGITDAAGKQIEGYMSNVRTIKLGDVPVSTPQLAVAKMPVGKETKGMIGGIIGMDILGPNWGIIDFGQQKIYIARAK